MIRPANLRGLSSDSTLIMVNGKRRHRASVIAFQGGGVNDGSQGPDISVIPSIALKSVEVLRDGAAAPSRSTSTDLRAMLGMTEISGP